MAEESTTPDLAELTRRAYESFSRRDLDAVMRDYDHDSVLDLSPAGLGSYEGKAAIRGFLRDWMGAWDELSSSPSRFSTSATVSFLPWLARTPVQLAALATFKCTRGMCSYGRRASQCGRRPTSTSRRAVLPPNALSRSGPMTEGPSTWSARVDRGCERA